MKSMMKSGVLAVAVALACSASLYANEKAPVERQGYAEGVYGDYSDASSRDLSFSLKTIESGPLTELSGKPIGYFLGAPDHLVVAESSGFGLANVQSMPVDKAESGYLDDLAATVDGFDEAGFPVSQGHYRLLEVTMEMDGSKQPSHVALEACWSAQKHCVIFDPTVEFLDSHVANLRKLRAEGWTILEYSEPVDSILDLAKGDAAPKAGRCGLASRPNSKSRSVVFPAYTVQYRNLYNIVVVEHRIGRVETGLRCDTRCKPQPFAYSNASSGWANLGFNIKCASKGTAGTTGSRGSAVAYSGCAHRAVLSAKFNLNIKGSGAGVDINIDSNGTVEKNGRKWTDSCAYF